MLGEDVSAGAWGEASMLVDAAIDGDKAAFDRLEGQVAKAWMPEALACIAARAIRDLAESRGTEPRVVLLAIMNSGRRYGPF